MTYIPRHVETKVIEAMLDTPIVAIVGPRQAGKSTLAERFIQKKGTHLTFDDPDILAASIADPKGLLENLEKPILIDEIQRNPLILPVIKAIVDQNRAPGFFILTGSANLLTLPKITESLAGRVEIIELLPFSQAELNQAPKKILDSIFELKLENNRLYPSIDLLPILIKGGYPETQNRVPKRVVSWLKSYIKSIVQRDIKEVFDINKTQELNQMLKVLSAYNAGLISANGISKKVSLDHKTVSKYIAALENTYLVREIPTWSKNELSRTTKQKKINFIDSGLLCALKGITIEKANKDRNLIGNLFESFVFSELLKMANSSDEDYTFYHYRDARKNEVDLIVENSFGDAIGIEIKSTKTASAELFKGLNRINAQIKLRASVVIYSGEKLLSFGENRWVIPIGFVTHGNLKTILT